MRKTILFYGLLVGITSLCNGAGLVNGTLSPVPGSSSTNSGGSGFPLTTNVDGALITNLNATNLTGQVPFLNGGNGLSFLASALIGVGTNKHLIYVSPTGNDGTGVRGDISHPYKTFYAWDGNVPGVFTGVFSFATNGDTVVILPGVHYAPVLLPTNGVNIVGIGMPTIYRTNVFFANDCSLSSGGPMLQPGNNSFIYGIHLVATNGSIAGSFDAPVGVYNQSGSPTSFDDLGYSNQLGTNWLMYHCVFEGTSDGVYINLVSSTQGTNEVGRFDTCKFNTGWDTGRFAGNAGIQITFVNCEFNAISDPRFSGGQGRCLVVSGGAIVTDIEGVLTFFGTDTNNTIGVSVNSGNSIATLYNTVIQPSYLQTTAYSNVFATAATVVGNYTTNILKDLTLQSLRVVGSTNPLAIAAGTITTPTLNATTINVAGAIIGPGTISLTNKSATQPITLVLTNSTGGPVHIWVAMGLEVTTAATGSVAVQFTATNLSSGQYTWTPSSVNTVSTGYTPFSPQVFVLSNNTSLTYTATLTGTGHYNLNANVLRWQ